MAKFKTDEEYFADREYVRKGWLDKITLQPDMGGSPAMLKAYLSKAVADKPTAAMQFGTAFHGSLLEGRALRPIHASRRGTKAYEGEVAMILESEPNAHCLPLKDYDRAMFMREAVMNPTTEAGEFAKHLLVGLPGMNEYVFHGTMSVDGTCLSDETRNRLGLGDYGRAGAFYDIKVKAKIDRLCADQGKLIIVDLKTSADASPGAFARSSAKFRYVYQQAYYNRVARRWRLQRTEHERRETDHDFLSQDWFDTEYWMVVVQSDRSGIVAAYQCDPDDIEREEEQLRADLALYAQCKLENKWPPAESKPTTLSLPSWYWRNNG